MPSTTRTRPALDLAALLPSWELALRAERKSPQTVKAYGDGVRQFLGWCQTADRPAELTRTAVTGFVAALLEAGAAPATARARQLAVRRFSAWLVDEQEADTDPLLGLKAPKLDTAVVEPLTDTQLKALLKACSGAEHARPPRRGNRPIHAGDRGPGRGGGRPWRRRR